MATKTLENVTVSYAYLALMADRGVEYLFANAGGDRYPPRLSGSTRRSASGNLSTRRGVSRFDRKVTRHLMVRAVGDERWGLLGAKSLPSSSEWKTTP